MRERERERENTLKAETQMAISLYFTIGSSWVSGYIMLLTTL
jgi:hypothetical protein